MMQERQDRQERDMAVLKNDIVKLRRELTAERELVKALRSHAADATWAIADVKRGHDQVRALQTTEHLAAVARNSGANVVQC